MAKKKQAPEDLIGSVVGDEAAIDAEPDVEEAPAVEAEPEPEPPAVVEETPAADDSAIDADVVDADPAVVEEGEPAAVEGPEVEADPAPDAAEEPAAVAEEPVVASVEPVAPPPPPNPVDAEPADGVSLQSAAHPGSELSPDSIETVEIEIADTDFQADHRRYGHAEALAIAEDECNTEMAKENGQIWVNCAKTIADRIRGL